jgi:hypothetical protein
MSKNQACNTRKWLRSGKIIRETITSIEKEREMKQ